MVTLGWAACNLYLCKFYCSQLGGEEPCPAPTLSEQRYQIFMMATWEGYRRNRGLSNIHNVCHTQATQTRIQWEFRICIQMIQGYQISMMATWERDIGETEGYQIFIMFAIHRQHKTRIGGEFRTREGYNLQGYQISMMATWEGYTCICETGAIKYS